MVINLYMSIKILPKSDFYIDPDKVTFINNNLYIPYIKGKNLSRIYNNIKFINENDNFEYNYISFSQYYNLIKSFLELYIKIKKFNINFVHGDLNLGNIIYNLDENKMYIIDFEYLEKQNDNFNDSDLIHMNNNLINLIEIGNDNIEIIKFIKNNINILELPYLLYENNNFIYKLFKLFNVEYNN